MIFVYGGLTVYNNMLCSHTDNIQNMVTFEDAYRKTDTYKLDRLYERIDDCGKKGVWLINTCNGEEFEVKTYCNLKACDNPACIDHRGYLFSRKHKSKISDIQEDMSVGKNVPLSWVFTDSKLSYPIDRKYCQERFKLCCRLVKKYSRSKYSIHMEIKLNDVDAYLHFHVLSSGITDLKACRAEWNRVIRYEFAVYPKNISKYVAKYASKTPVFLSELHREFYHLVTYKLIMHRFGSKVREECGESVFQLLRSLYSEINRALERNPYNWTETDYGRIFIGEYLEYKDPPSVCLDDFDT